MKNLIVIIVIVLSSIATASAQSIGIVLDPPKFSVGVIVYTPDFRGVEAFAAYEKGAYGLEGERVSIKKYSLGLKYRWLMAGYCRTKLSDESVKHFKHSFELGGAFDLYPRLRTGFIYDPLNKGGKMIFSFNIRKK